MHVEAATTQHYLVTATRIVSGARHIHLAMGMALLLPQRKQQQHHHHHSNLLSGEYVDLRARKLTAETCRKFGYMVATHKGQAVQAASYRDASGAICAQKIRTKDKNFSILGEAKKMTLFGSHLWTSGKKIVLSEGEIDCMSISQIQGHKWATCSIPNGSSSARKSILDNYDYLMNFQEIVLLFDQDESGQKAAIEVAEALPVGRVSHWHPAVQRCK